MLPSAPSQRRIREHFARRSGQLQERRPIIMSHPLDIPEFLKRDKSETRATHKEPATKSPREQKIKRPTGWYSLTKAEQEGTADATTIALRKQLEQDRKAKQDERFAKLKELSAQRPKLPKAAKPFKSRTSRRSGSKAERKAERFGVITDGGLVAFSFDAKGSGDARAILSVMRKRGELSKITVKSLRRLRPDDKGVGGSTIPHKECP
jgi:hypothetical protein